MENVKRCDNCFFSAWMMAPDRPMLSCMQKAGRVGRWRIVHLDDRCANFYPSGDFRASRRSSNEDGKLGDSAVRRIPLTRGKFAIVDAEDYYQLIQYKWQAMAANNTFYATGRAAGKPTKMHRFIMNAPPHLVVDHIDHNGLNNAKTNLRLCTHAQNVRNAMPNRGTTSKYKGVCRRKKEKQWIASIQLNRKIYHLGCFEKEIDAAKAYDKKAKELHSRFACLNFPSEATAARRRTCPP